MSWPFQTTTWCWKLWSCEFSQSPLSATSGSLDPWGNRNQTLYVRWCPSSLAKLVNITPISLWFITDRTIVNGVYKPTYNWGAPSCMNIFFDKHDHGKSTTKICTDSLHIMFPFKIGFAGQPCFITRVRVSYVSHQPVESLPMYLGTLSRAHNDLTLDWVRLVMVIPKCYPKLNGPKNIQNSIFTCRSDQLHWCLVGKGMIHNIYIQYIY